MQARRGQEEGQRVRVRPRLPVLWGLRRFLQCVRGHVEVRKMRVLMNG